ncbi:MAG: hypothetical protein QGG64_05550 [Candidatus Latescibacteria bacterium]|nr:hypothetical protein [Candidatus Latescibacterota bacterium]
MSQSPSDHLQIFETQFRQPVSIFKDNGDWLAAFNHSRRREPRMHPPTDPLFRTLLSRSCDQGATWEAPYFAPDLNWSGTECPGIAQLRDRTVVLTQFRFGWYPIGLARKRRSAGEPISIRLPEQGWTENFTDDDWDHSLYTWARGCHGVYAHLSFDGGYPKNPNEYNRLTRWRVYNATTKYSDAHHGSTAMGCDELRE